MKIIAILSILVSFSATSLVRADLITLSSQADAFVQQGNPGGNFGTGQITVKGLNGTTTRKGYIRFDLSGIPVADILDAEFKIAVFQNNSGGTDTTTRQPFTISMYGLNDGVGESWGESTINYSNAPANMTGNVLTSDATLLGTFAVPAVDPPVTLSFNPTNLSTFLKNDTDGQVTFILLRDNNSSTHNLAFSSKETSGMAPTLLINTIPEPGTIGLAIVGLTVLAGVRGRVRS